jgi:hypothetical protein
VPHHLHPDPPPHAARRLLQQPRGWRQEGTHRRRQHVHTRFNIEHLHGMRMRRGRRRWWWRGWRWRSEAAAAGVYGYHSSSSTPSHTWKQADPPPVLGEDLAARGGHMEGKKKKRPAARSRRGSCSSNHRHRGGCRRKATPYPATCPLSRASSRGMLDR